jgi:hypothetical protein
MATKNIKIDGSSLPILEFQLDWMVDNSSICMIAKRRSGSKNYLINPTSIGNSNAQSSDSVVDSKSLYLIGKSKLKLPNTDVFIDEGRF